MSSVQQAWEDIKRDVIENSMNDIANAYQDILIRGHLMPNRFVERDIAEAEFGMNKEEYDQGKAVVEKHTPEPEPGDLEPWS